MKLTYELYIDCEAQLTLAAGKWARKPVEGPAHKAVYLETPFVVVLGLHVLVHWGMSQQDNQTGHFVTVAAD